jgi:ubiquinone/menaquinone biosynthesis C-methylase UbiE
MNVSTDEIKKYYSEWWENPKDIRNVVFDSLNELVKERIPPGEGKKALDIGSGHGRIVSYLVEKGYEVTAVEFNEDFCEELKRKFPNVRVLQEDVRNLNFNANERFEVVTCIELVQNLNKEDLLELMRKLVCGGVSKTLRINISNKNSLHNWWIEKRGFKKDFVFNYTPDEFDGYLEDDGFRIVYKRGVGLVTPISLFSSFKGKLIPVWFAKMVNNKLDRYATKRCHLYYVEAISEEL